MGKKEKIHALLLEWYDHSHRHLPWRANPGEIPNPYYVLLSEIMLQQTTVATVINYFQRFIEKWPTIYDFAAASQDDIYHAWQGLGYYSRARNLHQCAKLIVNQRNGFIPSTVKELLALPGIGAYTSAAIAAIAYDQAVVPVDGNVVRVFSRLFDIETTPPQLIKDVQTLAEEYVPPARRGDFAQSLMDLGSLICRPSTPLCQQCPLQECCVVAGTEKASLLPHKKVKPIKPIRYGLVFWYMDDQHHLWLRRRPEKGLLANLMEFPSTEWQLQPYQAEDVIPQLLPKASWRILPKEVVHTFTHFQLRLTVVKAKGTDEWEGLRVKVEDLDKYALPTLMRKVMRYVLALEETS